MIKKQMKILIGCIALISLFATPAYAQTYQNERTKVIINRDDSVLLSKGETSSRDIEKSYKRGEILSHAIADITNGGDGDIILSLQTVAHVACDEIRHKAYLDQWDENELTWNTVDSFLFVETKEDHLDDELIYLSTTFVVKGQPKGYYYRVRGSHSAWLGLQGNSFTTRTDGIWIN